MRCRSSSLIASSARGLAVVAGALIFLCGPTLAAHAAAGTSAAGTSTAARIDEVPLAPTVVGDAELGVFAESRPDRNAASISPQVRLGLRPRPEVELHLSFGAVSVFADGPAGREQVARPSNLGFGASRVLDRREGPWRYAKVGFGFVLPTAFATNAAEQQAYAYALGGRAGWDPWTWTPESFGMVVPAEVRAQVGRRWVIGGDGALAGFLPSAQRTDGLALAAQIAAEARVVAREQAHHGVGERQVEQPDHAHPHRGRGQRHAHDAADRVVGAGAEAGGVAGTAFGARYSTAPDGVSTGVVTGSQSAGPFGAFWSCRSIATLLDRFGFSSNAS